MELHPALSACLEEKLGLLAGTFPRHVTMFHSKIRVRAVYSCASVHIQWQNCHCVLARSLT
jgi:hypothetical protein